MTPGGTAAEPIKLGILKSTSNGPIYIAREKGYFAAEDLAPELVFFEAGQPVAVATVSGDIDIGSGALTAGLFSLAGQGALHIVGGATREFPGFQTGAIVVSNTAYAAGLKTYTDLPGHSFAISTVGSPAHYAVGLLAAKYAIELKSLRLLPLQTNPNVTTAITGGQADSGIIQVTFAMPTIQRGDLKLLGWVGDETPMQVSAAFVSTRTASERGGMIERYLRAYRKGAREYHDAFTDADEKRKNGATASEVLAIIGKYVPQPLEQLGLGIGYIDASGRLDVQDALHQASWYKSQGLLKGEIDSDAVIDKRYVVPLPDR